MDSLTKAPTSERDAGSPIPTPAAAPVAEAPPAPKSAAEAAPARPIDALAGTYRWVGGTPEKRVLWRKIENIAATFNFIAKPIVEQKLAEGNVIPNEIRIAADADTVHVTTDGKTVSAPLDGSSAVKVKAINGEMMDVTFSVGDRTLTQTAKGIAKGRVNTYTLKDDGRLTLHVRVYASQLPSELVYDLTYERQ